MSEDGFFLTFIVPFPGGWSPADEFLRISCKLCGEIDRCTRRVAPSGGSFFSKSAYCAGYDSTAREGMAKTPPNVNFQAVTYLYDHIRPSNSEPSRSG